MFFKDIFARRQPRKFAYTPYFYDADNEEKSGERRRIQFQRIRQGTRMSPKSIRSLVILAIFVIICMVYFWNTIQRHATTVDIESIQIDEVPETP